MGGTYSTTINKYTAQYGGKQFKLKQMTPHVSFLDENKLAFGARYGESRGFFPIDSVFTVSKVVLKSHCNRIEGGCSHNIIIYAFLEVYGDKTSPRNVWDFTQRGKIEADDHLDRLNKAVMDRMCPAIYHRPSWSSGYFVKEDDANPTKIEFDVTELLRPELLYDEAYYLVYTKYCHQEDISKEVEYLTMSQLEFNNNVIKLL